MISHYNTNCVVSCESIWPKFPAVGGYGDEAQPFTLRRPLLAPVRVFWVQAEPGRSTAEALGVREGEK